MKRATKSKVSLFLALCASLPAVALADDWQYSLTPYAWFPNINGTMKFQAFPGAGGWLESEVTPSSYLSALDFGFMLSGEARKGKWGVLADFITLDLSSEKSSVKSIGSNLQIPVDVGTTTGFSGTIWHVGGFYNLTNTPATSIDLLAGMRYFKVDSQLDWRLAGPLGQFPQSGSLNQKENLLDGIVGIRGKTSLGSGGKWSIPFLVDVGAGDSSLTWQAVAGLAYALDWGDVQLSYRHLEYDQGNDGMLHNLHFSGPALSATFHF